MMKEGKVARHLAVGAAILLSTGLVATSVRADDGGKIAGKATFEGTPPAPTKIKMDADPICAGKNPNATSDDVVVGKDGALENVFVHVTGGLPAGKTYTAPTEPVTIDHHAHDVRHVVAAVLVDR
ncbi:MAG: hypothetical protein ACKPBU_16510, partial [Alphaproteobacteria bacterium]